MALPTFLKRVHCLYSFSLADIYKNASKLSQARMARMARIPKRTILIVNSNTSPSWLKHDINNRQR